MRTRQATFAMTKETKNNGMMMDLGVLVLFFLYQAYISSLEGGMGGGAAGLLLFLFSGLMLPIAAVYSLVKAYKEWSVMTLDQKAPLFANIGLALYFALPAVIGGFVMTLFIVAAGGDNGEDNGIGMQHIGGLIALVIYISVRALVQGVKPMETLLLWSPIVCFGMYNLIG